MASVGKTEEELKAGGDRVSEGLVPVHGERPRQVNRTTDGFVDLSDAKTDRAPACTSSLCRDDDHRGDDRDGVGGSAEDIARTPVTAIPTLSEAVKEAVLAVGKRAIDMRGFPPEGGGWRDLRGVGWVIRAISSAVPPERSSGGDRADRSPPSLKRGRIKNGRMRRLLKPSSCSRCFLFEACAGDICARCRVGGRPGPLDRLKARLPRIGYPPLFPTLLVFLIPVVLLFPLKLLGLWMLAHGSWLGAMTVLALAQVVSMASTAFIFDDAAELLQLGWFRG